MYWLDTFIEYEKRQIHIFGKPRIGKAVDYETGEVMWAWSCWCEFKELEETWEAARYELEVHMFEGQHRNNTLVMEDGAIA